MAGLLESGDGDDNDHTEEFSDQRSKRGFTSIAVLKKERSELPEKLLREEEDRGAMLAIEIEIRLKVLGYNKDMNSCCMFCV